MTDTPHTSSDAASETPHLQSGGDDAVITFNLGGAEDAGVRGRAIRLGAALDGAIIAERYPAPIARLLGDAMLIGALVAQSLKFKGRLLVQCHGTNDGAVSLLVADCTTDGHIRGYARYDEDMFKQIMLDNRNPGADTLIGRGTFAMTIDQGPDMDTYQGLSAIQSANLSDCAQDYFRQSEQVPTRIRLAVGEVQVPGQSSQWRGGGVIVQRIAGDAARGDTDDAWDTAKALFATVTDEELIDPDLPAEDMLYRLFNELGVRKLSEDSILAKCRCSRERLHQTLASYPHAEIEDMYEGGVITAECQFCAVEYVFTPDDLSDDSSGD